MVTKLDILNKRDGKDVPVGEELPWDIVDGKVQRVDKKEIKGATATVDGKDLRFDEKTEEWKKDKEIRVVGPTVKESIEVIVPEERKEKKEKRYKKGGSKRTQRRKK